MAFNKPGEAENCDDDTVTPTDNGKCTAGCKTGDATGWSCSSVSMGISTCVPVCEALAAYFPVNSPQTCNDGNAVSTDGCSSCTVMPGWVCVNSGPTFTTASTCTQTCGNGIADAGELCDDGNILNYDGCSSTC